ncbi:FAD-binding oxidoreductase [Synechococcus sp. PCC 7336]|uniref:NAD(P)/FAD-dependent oxidoreductase n=1 Tax=Synechococcus sp. PCC 7336 TaxID=195250 RepID=UPI0003455E83|nr:FAD-dependent oxidoreductase [Synechococcus sp. PCC 7336]
MKCDVAIIGCGVVGAAIAYELSRQSLSVVTLDAGAPAGQATGAALGVMMAINTLQQHGPVVDLRLASLARFETVVADLESQLDYSLPVNRQGLLRLIAPDAWEKWLPAIAARQVANYDLHPLDAEGIARLQPAVQWQGRGLHSLGDRQIEPRAFVQALVRAAQQKGAQFFFNEPVLRLKSERGRVNALYTRHRTLSAGTTIVAAGLGSSQFNQQLGLDLPIAPVKGQALRIRPAAPLLYGPPITDGDVNIVPLADGTYWIGATVEFDASIQSPTLGGIQTLMQQAIQLLPVLQDAELIDAWAGIRPRPSGQRAPILGRSPLHQNVIIATGHYRNGVLLAPITAQVVKDLLIEGKTHACDLSAFSPRAASLE